MSFENKRFYFSFVFFYFFQKRGVKFFENSLLIFHPINQKYGHQNFSSESKIKKINQERRRFIFIFFGEILTLVYDKKFW